MDNLPNELLLLIFEHSSSYDLTTSFQFVCKKWHYLINETESIWKGNYRLKIIFEALCAGRVKEILKTTPKLKYLHLGPMHLSNKDEQVIDYGGEETKQILQTILDYNKDIEYLYIVDRYPLLQFIRRIIVEPKFKILKVAIVKLNNRREKIRELQESFQDFPTIDDSTIDFCQKIDFSFVKNKSKGDWKISFQTEERLIL